MADLYQERQLQIPEKTAESIQIQNDRQMVVIEKKMYGAGSLGSLVDRGFEEMNIPKKIDLDKFFKDYDALFYDIPQEGEEKSHQQLILQSTDYVNNFVDPKDEEIKELEEKIEELEEQIDALENPEEHPYFTNGTVLSRGGGGNYWVMEKGKRRMLVGGKPGRVWKALKQALGYNLKDDDFDMGIVKNIDRGIVDGIDRGPDFDLEDLGSGKEESTQALIGRLGGKDLKIDPRNYDDLNEWLRMLESEIEQEWALERSLEQRHGKYTSDVKFGNEEEKAEAKEKKGHASKELTESRQRLVALKNIHQEAIGAGISGGAFGTVYMSDNQERMILQMLEGVYDDAIRDASDLQSGDQELRDFRGWENGKWDKNIDSNLHLS